MIVNRPCKNSIEESLNINICATPIWSVGQPVILSVTIVSCKSKKKKKKNRANRKQWNNINSKHEFFFCNYHFISHKCKIQFPKATSLMKLYTLYIYKPSRTMFSHNFFCGFNRHNFFSHSFHSLRDFCRHNFGSYNNRNFAFTLMHVTNQLINILSCVCLHQGDIRLGPCGWRSYVLQT